MSSTLRSKFTRRHAFSGLLLAAACVPPTESDPGFDEPLKGPTTEVKHQRLNLSWRVLSSDGTAAACPTTYGKVKVELSRSDAFQWFNTSRVGDLIVEVFDCSAGAGSVELQVSGPIDGCDPEGPFCDEATPFYSATMAFTEATGEVTIQATGSQLFDLSGGPKALGFDIYPGSGFLVTNWGLNGHVAPDALSCSAAGVAKLRVTYKHVEQPDGSSGSQRESSITHDCTPADEDWAYEYVTCLGCVGGGVSPPLDYGRYHTRLEALSPSGAVVGTTAYDATSFGAPVSENTYRTTGSTGGGNVARAFISSTTHYFVTIDNR